MPPGPLGNGLAYGASKALADKAALGIRREAQPFLAAYRRCSRHGSLGPTELPGTRTPLDLRTTSLVFLQEFD